MHQVARQDAQEAGGREASKLPEISDIGLRRCPHLNRRAATNAAPQSGTGGDQPTGRTQIVTFGRSTDRHGDDREAAQNGSLRIPSTWNGYAPRLPSHFHQNPAGIAPRAPSANENHVVPDALATPAEITSVGLPAMLSLAWRCRAGSPERGCCGWSARRIRERGGLAGQVPRGVGAALTRSQLFPQAWCRPGKLGSAGDHYAPGVARMDGRWGTPRRHRPAAVRRLVRWRRARTAPPVQMATMTSHSRSHPGFMTVLWVSTWVTFPPAAWGMGLATATWATWLPVSAIKMRGMPLTATPMATPVSSARRLPGPAGGVCGLPARRASTRAAISLSTFSRNDATTASLYSGPSSRCASAAARMSSGDKGEVLIVAG